MGEGGGGEAQTVTEEAIAPDYIRPDLQHVIDRHALGLDENRPDAVARRRKRNQRTVRENIAHLCDEGSFIEYGALALAAQRRRRSMEELLKMSPADGLVSGIAPGKAPSFGGGRGGGGGGGTPRGRAWPGSTRRASTHLQHSAARCRLSA